MKFTELIQHLECCPGAAGAMRKAWGRKTYIVFTHGGALAFAVGALRLPYALSFEDLTAEDWEPV